MPSHRILLDVDPSGIEVQVLHFDDEGQLTDTFDFNQDIHCAFYAKVLAQAMFAFTCLPPTRFTRDTLAWQNSSPSNSSSDGIDEHFHSGPTE